MPVYKNEVFERVIGFTLSSRKDSDSEDYEWQRSGIHDTRDFATLTDIMTKTQAVDNRSSIWYTNGTQ